MKMKATDTMTPLDIFDLSLTSLRNLWSDSSETYEMVVRAVNNHQFLLDSLKEIGLQLERGSSTIAIQKTVREAIAKAEGL